MKLLLLKIPEDPYERAGVIIDFQIPVAKRYKYIADAILDWLVPKAHRVELKGRSLRKKSENLS